MKRDRRTSPNETIRYDVIVDHPERIIILHAYSAPAATAVADLMREKYPHCSVRVVPSQGEPITSLAISGYEKSVADPNSPWVK